MQYRRLGQTDLEVSAVGLGGWALGGGYDWGNVNFTDVQNTVCAALDNGINLIDTAPIYGSSEEVLGRALAGRRQDVVLCTKCGLVKNGSWTDHDLRPEPLSRQLENSLKNLKTDTIDVYFIHYLDPQIPWQATLETLARLQAQGKIRYIGVCNIPPEILIQMAQTGIIACAQDELSLLHPAKGQAVLNVCKQYNLGFIAYGSLCGGILSGKYKQAPNLRRADARNYFYKCYRGEAFQRAQETVAQVQKVAVSKGVTTVQAALAWVLQQGGVTCALTGARSAAQIAQNARAADIPLRAEELYAA
ncbi:MAG: aldo/keto reductase [Elusimicrobiaceae bacterium]|nr:aldo/keto reductase [Elusimicrobiaceae bacterium]